MAGVIGRRGLLDKLETWTGKMASERYQVCLFTNDIRPAVGDRLALYAEPTFAGYKRQRVPAARVSIWNPGDQSYTVELQGVAFLGTAAATQPIYGYFLVDDANLWIAGERFADAPVPGGTPATPIVVIASINDKNQ